MSGALLKLEGLRKQWPDGQSALDGVHLDVAPGTILVVLGTSGAGKTTLLRVVAGLDVADEGRVVLGDRVLSDPGLRVRPESRGVGLVFQHLELWPHMTVAENIAFGLPGRPTGRSARSNDTVQSLARRVGVFDLLSRSPGTLSGGERQRVAIARTLAPDPDVLLYDEPLANLDPERRIDLRALIRALCRERGTTLLYVTHDAEEAMEMGDEIAVLHRGRVVDRNTPDALYARPSTLAGARALGPVNVLPARVANGRAETALGMLEIRGAPVAGAGLALLRPEALRPGPGIEAQVVEARPHGPEWAFTARVGETIVKGTAATPLAAGAPVTLEARGGVAVIDEEAAS